MDSDIKLVKHIEKEIIENKKSPEVIVSELEKNGFTIEITGKTIRNAIKIGIVFENLNPNKIIYKKEYNNKNEGDLIVGKQGTKAVLFTLTERKTRQEIIMKLENKRTQTIATALDKLERRYKGLF